MLISSVCAGAVVVVTAASTQEQPAAYAPAPSNATNATDGGVSNEAGTQPGENVGGVNYGGGLITQGFGGGGGGGGGNGAAQPDLVQGGSPVFPGGVQSFQVRRAAGSLLCLH